MTEPEIYFPDRCIECAALLSEMTCEDRCRVCLELVLLKDDEALTLQRMVAG